MTRNDIPTTATTFDATDFGMYTPRGFNPSRISGRITGIPIDNLFSGAWLHNPAKAGTMIIVRNGDSKELGRIYVNSLGDTPVFRATA